MSEPRDILEALFVGDDVAGADLVTAAHAAREDVALRALFDELALVDREVGGEFEARVGEAWFLDSLDAMLEEEAALAEPADNVVQLAAWRSRPQVMYAVAAVLAVGFSAIAYQQLRIEDRGEFQPRSAVTPTTHDYEMPSVEVFCVKRGDAGVEFVGSEQAEFATVRCGLDQEIKLAVRNPDARLSHAAFFGIGSDDSLYWYGPSPAAPGAFAVPTTSKLRPVGETIRLDVNHEPGTVRVVGVFTEQPLDFGQVEEWAKANEAELRDGQPGVDRGIAVRQTFEVTQ